MPEHVYEGTTPGDHEHDEDRACVVCDGGLAICTVCGCAEAELTTVMTYEQREASMACTLDYVAGAFVDTTSNTGPIVNVVLDGFSRAVRDAKDTEALVSVWIECRGEIQKNLEPRLQYEAWIALCRKAALLGQTHPRVWMKRAVIDEVDRRIKASAKAAQNDEYPR